MKILLVYPEYPETFWSFKYALKFISRKAGLPPLGLLTVASLLPKEWEKKLVDLTIAPLADQDIKWADYVFISAMSVQKESVKRIVAKCQRLGVKIVAGGPLFTTGPEDFKEIDYLVLNEAELTLPLFLEDLKNGRPKHLYKTDQLADLKKTPAPLLALANLKKYASMSLQYSRGCPFNCEFCNITSLLGRQVRVKAKDQILAELDNLHERGWRGSVFMVDDNFIGNKQELKKEVLPAIIDWRRKMKYPFIFNTQASMNLADDEELMRMMVQAGFNKVFVGIETPNEESLAECHKYQNKNRDLIAGIKKIQSFGLEVQAGFIVGFDNDPPSIFERLISFIQTSGITTAMVGLLNAPRGTKLCQRMIKEKRLLNDISGDNTDLSINFIPKMNREALITGYKKILRTIYSPKCYYERTLTFLKNFKPLPKKKSRFRLWHLTAFLKSVWFLGIRENGRTYYWKLLFWSLFRRPRLFSLAITLTVYGFHFRKIFGSY